jgi:hypothetical protein
LPETSLFALNKQLHKSEVHVYNCMQQVSFPPDVKGQDNNGRHPPFLCINWLISESLSSATVCLFCHTKLHVHVSVLTDHH